MQSTVEFLLRKKIICLCICLAISKSFRSMTDSTSSDGRRSMPNRERQAFRAPRTSGNDETLEPERQRAAMGNCTRSKESPK